MVSNINKTREILQLIALIISSLIVAFVIPTIIGTAFGGFEQLSVLDIYFQKTLVYTLFLIIGLLIIISLVVAKLIKPDSPASYIIHDPKNAYLPNIKGFRWLNSFRRTFLVAIILFPIIGLLSITTNTFFTGLPQTEFQVTNAGKVAFETEPASTSETIFFGAIMFLLLTLFKWLQKKFNWSNNTFLLMSMFFISIIIGLLGIGYHSIRYEGQERNILAVFGFFSIGTFLTISTGSLIFWWIWHISNNFFGILKILFAKESILLITSLILFIILIIIIIYFINSKKIKQNKDFSE